MTATLPESLTEKKIGVLGLGVEGSATARWLIDRGASITVCDRASEDELGAAYEELSELGVTNWRLGDDYLKNLTDFDVVFRTPLLPMSDSALVAAREEGVVVTSHIQLFMELCPAPIVGISGTKGKGTTAGLIHAMLQAGDKKSFLGGNIGNPPLEFLDQVTADSIVVLELSSFQLEDLDQSPHVAIITNLTSDHLDRHASVEEYRQAKRSLVTHQRPDDLTILNADDAGAKAMAEHTGGLVEWFSTRKPVSPGAWIENEQVHLETESVTADVCAVSDIPVPGKHNQANVLAASIAVASFNVTPEQMKLAIVEYHGLPYHLEFIRDKNGIRFFNDSYATNPTATIPAVESFDDPVVLIVGGSEKGLDFSELAETIVSRTIRGLVTIPPEGEQIVKSVTLAAKTAGKPVPPIKPVTKKEAILSAALELAEAGDVVLLSPAAASFGWFENYSARGAFFTDSVHAL
ncbi:UDP-N-acetylmuramoyl-L-alanine--D-glutamate ligase [Patescibacteria group bacterium]|nr:UDP-N-acetylmuramoyl-L-alanine--D-glutamate ligase [Patescibacteria group bacterium]